MKENLCDAKRLSLTGNQLKIIAMVAMFLGHLALAFDPRNGVVIAFGRIAFPIFAYMIAEGCRYTKNRAKYLSLIATLAALMQIGGYVINHSLEMSILVSFSLAIVAIFSFDVILLDNRIGRKLLAIFPLILVALVIFILPIYIKDLGFYIVYGPIGVLLPVAIYYSEGRVQKLLSATILLALIAYTTDYFQQWYSLMAVPFLALYNGKRGKANMKYLFYVFYPIQRLITVAIQYAITYFSLK